MGHIVTPAVPFVHQLRGLCGPACAQMILSGAGQSADRRRRTEGPVGRSEERDARTERKPYAAHAVRTFYEADLRELRRRLLLVHVSGRPGQSPERSTRPHALWATVTHDGSGHDGVRARQRRRRHRHSGVGQGPPALGRRPRIRNRTDRREQTSAAGTSPRSWFTIRSGPVRSKGSSFRWRAGYLEKITCGSFSGHIVVLGKPATRHSKTEMKKGGGTWDSCPSMSSGVARTKSRNDWRHSLLVAVVRAKATGTPIYVRSLEQPERDYFLVDFSVNGVSTGRLVIGAHEGELREISGIDTMDQPFLRCAARTPRVGSRSPAGRGHAAGAPLPIPSPKRGSSGNSAISPGHRFFRFTRSLRAGHTVYVRVDGERFKELTNYGAG